jgi:hypothetical protein
VPDLLSVPLVETDDDRDGLAGRREAEADRDDAGEDSKTGGRAKGGFPAVRW